MKILIGWCILENFWCVKKVAQQAAETISENKSYSELNCAVLAGVKNAVLNKETHIEFKPTEFHRLLFPGKVTIFSTGSNSMDSNKAQMITSVNLRFLIKRNDKI